MPPRQSPNVTTTLSDNVLIEGSSLNKGTDVVPEVDGGEGWAYEVQQGKENFVSSN